MNRNKNFFIFLMSVVILFDKQQNIVYIDFNLLN